MRGFQISVLLLAAWLGLEIAWQHDEAGLPLTLGKAAGLVAGTAMTIWCLEAERRRRQALAPGTRGTSASSN